MQIYKRQTTHFLAFLNDSVNNLFLNLLEQFFFILYSLTLFLLTEDIQNFMTKISAQSSQIYGT